MMPFLLNLNLDLSLSFSSPLIFRMIIYFTQGRGFATLYAWLLLSCNLL